MRKIEREEKTIVRYFSKVICGGLLLFALLIAFNGGGSSVYAAELSDGTYTIDYMIKKPDDESVSMANDYWEKPATVIVSGGAISVRMTINHSEWVTQFKTPSGSSYADAKVISEDAEKNTRLVQFSLDSLDKPMLSKIHVTVPEIDYDHDYTIRFVYDTDTLKLISEPKASTTPQASATLHVSTTPQASAKPQAGATPQASVKPQAGATTQASAKPQASATPQQSTSTTQPSAAAKGDEKAAEGSSAQSKTGTTESAASADDTSSKDDDASSTGDNDKETDENKALLEQTEDNNEGAEQSNNSSNANSANTKQGNAAADDQKAVELTAALDGAVEENSDTIVAASVEQAPSKKNGVLTIVFLAVLLVASIIVIAVYRKRKSKAA
ncbi:hypothetical protein J40TS1_11270 [Paenibacillus montaniterrae]|uniref:NEAT domain-containing protein n=1 Tax=Paenibacillus montaniterrae TaxID=429341 RepID=A0A920CWQ1_9BACL|nr:NEAT domain-containing protein [Paenibacillus montaniterrae]GIP15485.1 hypothetical protein J40TS1_11270 [Paenibacillus montaniterrae]